MKITKTKLIQGRTLVPQEKTTKRLFWAGVASTTLALAVVLLSWQKLPPDVPLFYSRPWGEEQLANPVLILLPLGLGTLALLVNLVFASLQEDSFLKRVLILGGTTAAILLAITIIRIVLLVS